MVDFPHSRAQATSFVDGQRITGAQATVLDENAAAAASGDVWSDMALMSNYPYVDQIANCGYSPVLAAQGGVAPIYTWYSFGVSAGNPIAYTGTANGQWTVSSVLAGAGLTPGACRCSAVLSVGSDIRVVMGGTPGSASTSKIRYGNASGGLGTAANTVASSTEGVTGMQWHSGAALLVIGLSNTATTNIETSPDGITWTQRTAPNSNARGRMASNGTIIVVLPAQSISTNACITSTDCATWTSRTLPSTDNWNEVVWSAHLEKFFAFADDMSFAYSSDGITWSAGSSGAFRVSSVGVIGRALAMGYNGYSGATGIDSYAGYLSSTSFAISPVLKVGSGVVNRAVTAADNTVQGTKQVLITDTDGNHFMSLRGGY